MRLILGFIACLFFIQHVSSSQTSINELFLGSRQGDPDSIVENVSTIYGDYTD